MTAPTEAEIREAIVERGRYPLGVSSPTARDALRDVVDAYAANLSNPAFLALEFDPADGDPTIGDSGDVWQALDKPTARRLRMIVRSARAELAADLERQIVDRLTAAGLTFAAEYPDAPRAVREAAPA